MADKLYFWSGGDEAFKFLSNFYRSPFRLGNCGIVWPCVENYYQAAKAASDDEFVFIASSATPTIARQRGKDCVLVDDWDKKRDDVMRDALVAKFSQNEDLRDMLLATDGFELIHFSPWDLYWGINKRDIGQNELGKLLMKIRDEMKASK